MCELLVGLPDVVVLWVIDDDGDEPIRVYVETRGGRPCCRVCGVPAGVKERPEVELVDLCCFGRQARLVWRKYRWQCANGLCGVGSWTGEERRIAAPRLGMTDRAARWATEQIGRVGRSVSDVAGELGCAWHTVNDAVIAYGSAPVEDPDRIGPVTALGLDKTLFCRQGPWRRQQWCTSIVDVESCPGQLLDVVEGRSEPKVLRLGSRSPGHMARGDLLGCARPVRSVSQDVL
ncbi:MAG: hypothetical protein DYH08_03685 [Actinobacteria bacterium ATB1]|nr:hypothetical protein [Actinobacteria bacterium ATB1]